MTGYSIGVRGCQHLGYGASGMRLDKATRWNQRVVDGHYAHQATMQSMIDAGVVGIVDGGDLMHFNRPLPRDVAVANRVDDLRAATGIWGVANSGNHDAGGGSDISATGVIHRPHLAMQAVYPDPTRPGGVGPYPGLYEVHTAASNPSLPDGLALHLVSHYGLSRFLPDQGVVIDPAPLPGMVNLLFTHGTFEADGRLYHCLNHHGEERAIPIGWANRGFDKVLLSHFHTMGPVPGTAGDVWYTGSALRRGFVDDPGDRGWLRVTVHGPGRVDVAPVLVWQRPQHDLPWISAEGLSVTDLDDLITAHLADVNLTDEASGRLTGDPGAIVRQKITGTSMAQRQGLAQLRGRYASLAADAAHWAGLVFDQNRTEQLPGTLPGAGWQVTQRITDYTTDLQTRFPTIAHRLGVPERLHTPVLDHAVEWTDKIAPDATSTTADPTGPGT